MLGVSVRRDSKTLTLVVYINHKAYGCTVYRNKEVSVDVEIVARHTTSSRGDQSRIFCCRDEHVSVAALVGDMETVHAPRVVLKNLDRLAGVLRENLQLDTPPPPRGLQIRQLLW